MPWCPWCHAQYRDGFDTCSECGGALVTAATSLTGIAAGLIGGLYAYAILGLLVAVAWGGGYPAHLVVLWPVCCSVTAFHAGCRRESRFMSSLIGWLLASSPFLLWFGSAYAKAGATAPLLEVCLTRSWVLSPLIIGPFASLAGTRFAQAGNRRDFALWLLPTLALAVILLILGGIVDHM